MLNCPSLVCLRSLSLNYCCDRLVGSSRLSQLELDSLALLGVELLERERSSLIPCNALK